MNAAKHIHKMVRAADLNTEAKMKNNITITLSKIMAFALLFSALALDFVNTKSAATFMYAVPFICTLVLGKQGIDLLKAKMGAG
jgi:hypothetical protein